MSPSAITAKRCATRNRIRRGCGTRHPASCADPPVHPAVESVQRAGPDEWRLASITARIARGRTLASQLLVALPHKEEDDETASMVWSHAGGTCRLRGRPGRTNI